MTAAEMIAYIKAADASARASAARRDLPPGSSRAKGMPRVAVNGDGGSGLRMAPPIASHDLVKHAATGTGRRSTNRTFTASSTTARRGDWHGIECPRTT